MKKSSGKMALLLGVSAALGFDMSGSDASNVLKTERPKTVLTPKQKKARARNNAGLKARKNHR